MAKRALLGMGLCASTLALAAAWSSAGCSPVTRTFATGAGTGGAGTGGAAAGTGGTGTGGAGTGGVAPCTPNQTVTCYDGPPATRNVGACADGLKTCQADGGFGPCMGETTPVPVTSANCAMHMDLDCDGMTDHCALDYLWGHVYGASSNGGGELVAAVADRIGNVLVAGVAAGALDVGLDGGSPDGSSGGNDALVMKLDPGGQTLWAQRYNDLAKPQNQVASAVGTDAMGNVFVGGEYSGTMTVGSTALPASAGNSPDAFVLKLDPNGNLLWQRAGGNTGTQQVQALAGTPSGGVVVAGTSQGPFAFNFGAPTLNGTAGVTTAFVQSFDALGNSVVHTNTTAPSPDAGVSAEHEVASAAVDPSGKIVVAGYYTGTITFPGGASFTSAGGNDVWVMALDGTSGTVLWQQAFGGSGDDRANGVAFDMNGDVLLGGVFSGSMKLGSTSVSTTGAAGLFLARLAGANGTVMTAKGYGSGNSAGSNLMFVHADTQNDVLLAGGFDGTLSLGGDTFTASSKPGNSQAAVFVAKLDPSFSHLASKAFGQNDLGGAAAFSVVAGLKNAVAISGFTAGPIDLGGGSVGPMAFAPFVAEYAP